MVNEYFKTKIVVNPRSANGHTGANWDAIQQQIRAHLPAFDFVFTEGPMHAEHLAREALWEGYEMVVAAGGDGTTSEIVNGFFDNGAAVNPDAVLGVLPMGTGCDFVKTLGIPKPVPRAAAFLAGRHTMPCDVGHITYVNHEGREAFRYFINITDFGIGGDVVMNVNRTTKVFGGFFSFLWGTIRSQLTYRARPVRLIADARDLGERTIHSVVVANGRFCGGGMRIARGADLNDGTFEIIVIQALSTWEGFRLIRDIYSGAIVEYGKKVEHFKARELRAESDEIVLLDVDGEQPGRLPCTLRVLPAALRLKTLP